MESSIWMYLPPELMRIILEFKYYFWLEEKKCLCFDSGFGWGVFDTCVTSDYKACPNTAVCKSCYAVFCYAQDDFHEWINQCTRCHSDICGDCSLYRAPPECGVLDRDDLFCEECAALLAGGCTNIDHQLELVRFDCGYRLTCITREGERRLGWHDTVTGKWK